MTITDNPDIDSTGSTRNCCVSPALVLLALMKFCISSNSNSWQFGGICDVSDDTVSLGELIGHCGY